LIYWGVGNPAPVFNSAARSGDNLYSNSVVALRATTGELAWHFQFTPNDDHDFDSVQTPLLIDTTEKGITRKLLAVANRNAFFYVLNRENGQFLRAAPYAQQTWATGITPEGRPIRRNATAPTVRGTSLYPSVEGGTNWWASAYSPTTGLYYVPVVEQGGSYFSTGSQPDPLPGKFYLGGFWRPAKGAFYTAVRAIDPLTAAIRWEHRWPLRYDKSYPGGLLTTSGGIVFGSDLEELFALDSTTGKVLWSFRTGGKISGAPISFHVGGQQVIAVNAGQALLTFSLPDSESATSTNK
jgi:alcohol dehydrogenase (cytochrome c)